MAATGDITKRKRPAQTGTPVLVRLQPEQIVALDDWISGYNNPNLTRPMAIRLLMQMALQDRRKAPREPAISDT